MEWDDKGQSGGSEKAEMPTAKEQVQKLVDEIKVVCRDADMDASEAIREAMGPSEDADEPQEEEGEKAMLASMMKSEMKGDE